MTGASCAAIYTRENIARRAMNAETFAAPSVTSLATAAGDEAGLSPCAAGSLLSRIMETPGPFARIKQNAIRIIRMAFLFEMD
jgi:hypothetical protein